MCAARRRAFADLGALAGHDGRKVEPLALLRERFPALDFRDVQVVEDGWDSLVLDLDGKWIVRFPRRPEVEQWIEREIALLPELAQRLPVEVPRFELIAHNGVVCVGYRKLAGSPARSDVDERTGGDLGRFLSALHGFPVDHACALGIPYFDRTAWREHFTCLCADFRQRVLRLLRPSERERAETVFARVETLDFVPVLLHADLGPEHVLCRDGRVVGVIDWSDARRERAREAGRRSAEARARKQAGLDGQARGGASLRAERWWRYGPPTEVRRCLPQPRRLVHPSCAAQPCGCAPAVRQPADRSEASRVFQAASCVQRGAGLWVPR
jgi:aminoglycoside 2''-phosphotransferase